MQAESFATRCNDKVYRAENQFTREQNWTAIARLEMVSVNGVLVQRRNIWRLIPAKLCEPRRCNRKMLSLFRFKSLYYIPNGSLWAEARRREWVEMWSAETHLAYSAGCYEVGRWGAVECCKWRESMQAHHRRGPEMRVLWSYETCYGQKEIKYRCSYDRYQRERRWYCKKNVERARRSMQCVVCELDVGAENGFWGEYVNGCGRGRIQSATEQLGKNGALEGA